MLWQCCAYGLVRLRPKPTWSGLGKDRYISFFDFKIRSFVTSNTAEKLPDGFDRCTMVLSPQTWLEMLWCLVRDTQWFHMLPGLPSSSPSCAAPTIHTPHNRAHQATFNLILKSPQLTPRVHATPWRRGVFKSNDSRFPFSAPAAVTVTHNDSEQTAALR